MQLKSVDDFLGTSIQFSEQQLIALEAEHALKLELTVARLIQSGFLDSDYDGSSGTYTNSSSSDLSSYSCSDLSSVSSETETETESESSQPINNNYNNNIHNNCKDPIIFSSLLLLMYCLMVTSISLLTSPRIQTDTKCVLFRNVINFWSNKTKCNNQLINDILSISPVPLPKPSAWSIQNESNGNKNYKFEEIDIHSESDIAAQESDHKYLKVGLWVAVGVVVSHKAQKSVI